MSICFEVRMLWCFGKIFSTRARHIFFVFFCLPILFLWTCTWLAWVPKFPLTGTQCYCWSGIYNMPVSFLPSLLSSLLFSFLLLSYLFNSVFIYFLTYLSTSTPHRIHSFRFQAAGHSWWPNLSLVCCVLILSLYVLSQTQVCFCCVCFRFSVLSQQIGWEERLRNDLFCVGWDVKP